MPAPGSSKYDWASIEQMYVDRGMSTVAIAAEVGASDPATIRMGLLKRKVPMRNAKEGARQRTIQQVGFEPTKEWLEEALAAFGGNVPRTAAYYKVPYPTFYCWLKRFSIPRVAAGVQRTGKRSGRKQDIPVEEAVSLSSQGHTYQQIAERYDVSYGVVVRRMKEAGHTAPWRRVKDLRFSTTSFQKRKILQDLGIEACEICGESRALDFCHIKPSHADGPTDKLNVLILCSTHHRCFDKGLLTQPEFEKVKNKVRAAEVLHSWACNYYQGW